MINHFDGSTASHIDADVCIVGAGAAGIAIARTFIGTSTTVCLLEAGGFSGEEAVQAIYEGASIGAIPFDLVNSRMRVLGGTCTLWGGGCIPLSSHDLENRDWVPFSGWPLSYDELTPYYSSAREFCQIDSCEFEDGSFSGPLGRLPLAFDADKIVNRIFARSPALFGQAYRSQLEAAPNIHVLLHASLLELEASADGLSICQARIGSLNGSTGSVRARQFVLACGGIENARLLLLSNSVKPQGLGNDRDLVGRFLMDHPSGKLGIITTDTPDQLTRPYERQRGKTSGLLFPEICLSDEFQKSHQLLSGRVHPFPVPGAVPKGIRALRNFRSALHSPSSEESALLEARMCTAMRNWPIEAPETVATESIGKLAWRLAMGAGDIAWAVAQKVAGRPTVQSSHVDLIGFFEQAPNPASRVTLGSDLDAMGRRKACVDWQFTPLDRQTYRTAAVLFGEELATACSGKFHLDPWLSNDADSTPQVHGTGHHLGTTRMANHPDAGVVDSHCRVHGIDNLHIAGSSVFPTGGWAFPTFTIVALSLRLAQDLHQLLSVNAHLIPTDQPVE